MTVSLYVVHRKKGKGGIWILRTDRLCQYPKNNPTSGAGVFSYVMAGITSPGSGPGWGLCLGAGGGEAFGHWRSGRIVEEGAAS